MKHRLNVVTVALAAAGFACTAGAQNAAPQDATHNRPKSTASTASHPVSAAERTFAIEAAQAGMAEVEEGKLAQQKAQSDQVKQLGERMVQDHTKADDRLKDVAASNDIALPQHLDKKGEKEIDELGKLSGARFDASYTKKQVSDHESVIKEFEKEAKSGRDAGLRAFASENLPTLEQHLNLARQAEQAAGAEKSASASNPSSSEGLKAAQKGTGATRAAVLKQDRMPVPKTGM